MKKAIRYIKIFSFFIVILICISTFILFAYKSNLFKYKSTIILSGSMSPALNVDDLVFTKKTTEIKVGDIISFEDAEGKKVMHRVIAINGNEITTKGDANNVPDKVIKKSQIEGVYAGKIKHVGKVIRFIKSPFGIVLGLLIIVVILFPSKPFAKEEINTLADDENGKENKKTIMWVADLSGLILIIGGIVVSYYSKYQTTLSGGSQITVASWDNNLELLSEEVMSIPNGELSSNVIQFNLIYNSEVSTSYNISLNNVSPHLGLELSSGEDTLGVKKASGKFTINFHNEETVFDINQLQSSKKAVLNGIEATYLDNATSEYQFKEGATGKIISVQKAGSNYNYSFYKCGSFQVGDEPKKLYTLKLNTLETELPNLNSIELFATFEQID